MEYVKVKTALLFFIISFTLPSILYAQPPAIEWQKCLGGTGFDQANCIIQTTDGGYAIAGYTLSDDGDVSGNHDGSYYPQDAWIAKLNSTGDLEWQKCIGGTGQDYAYSIIQTLDGGYAVCGLTYSTDGDFTGSKKGDAWAAKLDSLGNIQWVKRYGGSKHDWANCILQTSEEGRGYIFAGVASSSDGDVSGNHNAKDTTDDFSDAWIVKLTSEGNIEWQKCLGGIGGDEAQSIIQTSEGGYAIAGWANSTDGDVSGYHKDSTHSTDEWIVKFNFSGSIEWQKCLGGSGNEDAYSIMKTFDGGYAVVGETTSNDGDVSGHHNNPNTLFSYDGWIVKLNSSGEIEWQKCLGGTQDDALRSIVQNSDSSYVVAGFTESVNDGDVSGYHTYDSLYSGDEGHYDVWVVNVSPSGSLIGQKCYGGRCNEEAYSIVKTSDSGYAFAGYATTDDGDISGSHSDRYHFNEDVWVVKLNETLSGVDITYTDFIQNKFLWIYPNPSADHVILQLLQSLTMKRVQFYDLMGIERFPQLSLEAISATVDVHNLPNGTYITRVAYIRKGVGGTFSLPLIVEH